MWPKSLRGKLLLITIVVVVMPILVSGYIMILNAEKALVVEKQHKLFGAGRMLDQSLIGTYDDILGKHNALSANKETQIAILNQELRKITDQVAEAYPGIGVGYYNKKLDAIITYGPSSTYDTKVGLPISENHEGRVVMETGIEQVQEGQLVRGIIMNTMIPIIRNGEVIGYIWANELTSDIHTQFMSMKNHVYLSILLGLILGITGIVYLIDKVIADINLIKRGILHLRNNLTYRLPTLTGEVGEISNAINEMANSLEEKKALEQQVSRTERLAAVGEVAAGLAHEIRNPLMSIKGFAQLMNENITSTEKADYIEIIVQEADRMNNLIERLLCFARPAKNEVSPIAINTVLLDTIPLVAPQAIHNNIEIVSTIEQNLPLILANSGQLQQVLLNIVINAIQAVKRDGVIKISTLHNQAENVVHIIINDSGPGITPEIIDKLFDPFFTTKENGTGLGLSVANCLMENWGGKILVDSMLGHGSVFTLVLPTVGSNNLDNEEIAQN